MVLLSSIAKEESNDDYFINIIDAITKKRDDEDHLFALKIAVFDQIKEVNESDDVEGKKKIRQAKNKIELFRAVFDMIE
jgi:KaiC/GvpD/RAD55 family RecA-like ATPase